MPSQTFQPRNKYGGYIVLDQFESKMHEGKVFDIHGENLGLSYNSSANAESMMFACSGLFLEE